MYRFYYRFLPASERQVYQMISSGVTRHLSSIPVSGTPDQIRRVMPMIIMDHPELYSLENSYSVITGALGSRLVVSYSLSEAEMRDLDRELKRIGDRFLEEVRKRQYNNLGVIRYVHDFLIHNTVYDYEAASRLSSRGEAGSIIGVLLRRKAVCMGIALAAKWLLDLAGIPSAVAEGFALPEGEQGIIRSEGHREVSGGQRAPGEQSEINHAWNLVCLNDVWQLMDVTMDLGATHGDWISYAYFMRSQKAMDAYTRHEPYFVDLSRETGSYFARNHAYFQGEEELKAYLVNCVREKRQRILFCMRPGRECPSEERVLELIRRYLPAGYRYQLIQRMNVIDIKR